MIQDKRRSFIDTVDLRLKRKDNDERQFEKLSGTRIQDGGSYSYRAMKRFAERDSRPAYWTPGHEVKPGVKRRFNTNYLLPYSFVCRALGDIYCYCFNLLYTCMYIY